MIFSLATFTLAHVVLSLVGIGSGIVVLLGLMAGKRLNTSTALFLATTVATSVTGYGFPFTQLLPSHIVGAISLVVLAGLPQGAGAQRSGSHAVGTAIRRRPAHRAGVVHRRGRRGGAGIERTEVARAF